MPSLNAAGGAGGSHCGKIILYFFSEFQTLSWQFKPNNGNNSSDYDYKILRYLIRKQQKSMSEKTNTASYNRV